MGRHEQFKGGSGGRQGARVENKQAGTPPVSGAGRELLPMRLALVMRAGASNIER